MKDNFFKFYLFEQNIANYPISVLANNLNFEFNIFDFRIGDKMIWSLVENNSGTGVHMGSPRPLDTNSSVYVRNITATNNGYYFERAGFDNSWPNEFSLVLIGNKSDSNYINYDIQGYGVIMIDNKSIGTVFVQDKLEGAIINYDFSN